MQYPILKAFTIFNPEENKNFRQYISDPVNLLARMVEFLNTHWKVSIESI